MSFLSWVKKSKYNNAVELGGCLATKRWDPEKGISKESDQTPLSSMRKILPISVKLHVCCQEEVLKFLLYFTKILLCSI